MRNPENAGHSRNKAAYSLYHGRSRTPLVTVVRDDEQSLLYRIAWPDIGPSPPANLTRCMAAARDWAEQSFLTEHRKLSGARRLKSLNKFWWSASPIEKSGPKHVENLDHSAAPELSVPMEGRRENSTAMYSLAARDRLPIPVPPYSEAA